MTHYILPMDMLLGTTLINPSGLDSSAFGSPNLIKGLIKRAIRLNGRDTYVKVVGPGHRSECFGDLDKCPSGRWRNVKSVKNKNQNGERILEYFSPNTPFLLNITCCNQNQSLTSSSHIISICSFLIKLGIDHRI